VRRSAILLAALALALPALASGASAAPTVGLKARFVPIPGFPGTGDILGAGTAVQSEYSISGSEYGGFPPPLVGIDLLLPEGVVLYPQGFPACPPATLEQVGRCAANTHAGPLGHAFGVVSFGAERVPEEVEIQPYYLSGSGLALLVAGHSPVALEFIAKGHYVTAGGAFGEELVSEVPLVETVPGAPDASLESITLRVGSALAASAGTVYYLTMPDTCPNGGFPIKAELMFAGLGGLAPQTVAATYAAPCPQGSHVEEAVPQTSLPGTGGVVTAPPNNVCRSRRDFKIHIVQIKGLTNHQVSVYVNGRRVNVVRGARISAPVDLRGLPKGRYVVRITVTTTTGRRITGTRAYHTCAPKPLHPRGQPRL
jgi:hypothetical protein